MKKLTQLLLCILIPLIIGGFSGYITSTSIIDWYATIIKPSFNPPNYIFGPVWTLLYILMGISMYIVLNHAKYADKSKLICIFSIQLFLNFCWSIIFFNFHSIGFALIEIVFLWMSIFSMIAYFYQSSKLAAYLNIPYLMWVSFATFLNYSIYRLN